MLMVIVMVTVVMVIVMVTVDDYSDYSDYLHCAFRSKRPEQLSSAWVACDTSKPHRCGTAQQTQQSHDLAMSSNKCPPSANATGLTMV